MCPEMIRVSLYQSRDSFRTLQYRFDASFVDFESSNERFNVGRVLLRVWHVPRIEILPVLLAPLGDFKTAI